jgi:tetratricopeptide (TPR) repeat protein
MAIIAEKKISELSGRTKTLFDYAQKAIQQRNHDYAIELFRMLLLEEPGCEEVRQMLRQCQVEKHKELTNKTTKVINDIVAAIMINTKGQFLLGKKKWSEALDLAEAQLSNNPFNPAVLKFFYGITEKVGLPKSGGEALELCLYQTPKDPMLIKQVAAHYQRANDSVKVLRYMQRLANLKPSDLEVQNALKQATAAAAMQQGNWDKAGSYRDIMKNKKDAAASEQMEQMTAHDDETLQSMIKQVEEMISVTASASNYKRLADLYKQGRLFEQAIDAYQKSIEKLGSFDPSVDDSITECLMGRFDDAIAQWKEHIETHPDQKDEAEEQIKAIEQQREETIFERYRQRSERYPNNANYRFALGELYFAREMYDEALAEFQVSARNPQLRQKATIYLGKSMMEKGLHAFAIEQFQKAQAEYLIMDATKKELLYNLGTAYELAGQKEHALSTFKEIFSVDINYRDVSQRIETYYRDLQAAKSTPASSTGSSTSSSSVSGSADFSLSSPKENRR